MAQAASGETAAPLTGKTAWARSLGTPLRSFLETEGGSAAVLLAATLAALVWANSPWGETYDELWSTELSIQLGDAAVTEDLRHWVNDGLMTFFFFIVGLEIRRELDMGDFRDRRRALVPAFAALGGLVVPALLYVALNVGRDTVGAWGIAMATDTAFALGVLALVGGRWSLQLRVFILTLVIVDDIAALLVIAVVYTEDVSASALAVAGALFVVVLVLRRLNVWRARAYFVVGTGIWVAMLESGVHPSVAGVALGLVTSAWAPLREDLERATVLTRRFREQPTAQLAESARLSVEASISPNERLQARLHPWTSFVIVPLFALSNAGVDVSGELLSRAARSPVTLGIVLGLVLGKLVGIPLATVLATRVARLPLTVPLPPLIAAAAVGGIGFTVSLLIADLAFDGERLEEAKVGILTASLAAALLGAALFRVLAAVPPALLDRLEGKRAAPLTDLDLPVDPELDHIRGPASAPVTIVEYGDFECPYCGRAEPAIRATLARFGNELRYVFRHLPLQDVHQHAQLAAEAAEAAHAQGAFWEMHDILLHRQDALTPDRLLAYAAELGVDVDRFERELRRHEHAPRIARDVESADLSGVSGTPTFFINGRRHPGAYDEESLARAVEAAKARPADEDALSPLPAAP